MNHTVVNDFNMLFNIVCANHRGPVSVDFGRQMSWEGIVAGQCTQHVHFLQAQGMNAFLDVRTSKLIFSEGSPVSLHHLLEEAMAKEAAAREQGIIPTGDANSRALLQTQ